MRDKMKYCFAPVWNYTERVVVTKKYHTCCNPVLPVPLELSLLRNTHILVSESSTIFHRIPMKKPDIVGCNIYTLVNVWDIPEVLLVDKHTLSKRKQYL